MSLLGKVLKNVGGWMVHEAQLQEQADLERMKADILYSRELALKQVDIQAQDARDEKKHGYAMEEIGATGAQNRLTAVTQAVAKERSDAASDARDFEKDVTLKKIDFTNSASLEGLKHKYNVSEIQARSAADLSNTLAEAGVTVDHWQVSPKGELAAYSKDGHLLTQTGVNVAVPPKSGDSGDDDPESYFHPNAPSSARTARQPTPAAPAAVQPTTAGYKPGDTVRNKAGQVLQLDPDGKWKPYTGIAP